MPENDSKTWSQIDIAWMAGIIEGEGCLSCHPISGWRVIVSMTDKDVIHRIHKLTGCGSFRQTPGRYEGNKTVYSWLVAERKNVLRIITAIAPQMGERRKQRIFEIAESIQKCSIAICEQCGNQFVRQTTLGRFCHVNCNGKAKYYRDKNKLDAIRKRNAWVPPKPNVKILSNHSVWIPPKKGNIDELCN